MQVELVVVEGKQQGAVIPIRSKFLVGREEDCQLRPNSELVSRHHCVFTIDDYTVRLRDLGSTNGTYVNEERTNGLVVLKSGDRVRIGKLMFEVRIQMSAPAPAAQPTAQPAPPPRPAPQPMAPQHMPMPQPVAMHPHMPAPMPMQGYPMGHPQGYPMPPQYPAYPYQNPSTSDTTVDWPVPQYLDPSQSGTGIYAGDTALIQGANKGKKPAPPMMPVQLPDPSKTGAPEPAPPPVAAAPGAAPAPTDTNSRSSAADIIRQYLQPKPR